MHKIWLGKIKNGKLKLFDRDLFKQFIASQKDKDIELIIRSLNKQRSIQQNRYYWGVIIKILGEDFGYDDDEMHEALKWEFLRIPGDNGKPDRVKSTRNLSTIEFENYCEKIRTWASIKFNIYIPQPNEILIEEDQWT